MYVLTIKYIWYQPAKQKQKNFGSNRQFKLTFTYGQISINTSISYSHFYNCCKEEKQCTWKYLSKTDYTIEFCTNSTYK